MTTFPFGAAIDAILGSNPSSFQDTVSRLLKDIKTEQPSIVQYLRSKTGQFKGCLLATKNAEGTVSIGWSLCNGRDLFDKRVARQLAYDRATTVASRPNRHVPNSIENYIPEFVLRASRYFKVEASTILCDTHEPKAVEAK